MLDLFWQKQFNDIYDIFAGGSPPLLLQLLALNTAYMLVQAFWKAWPGRVRHRHSTVNLVQALLLAANIVTVLRSDPAISMALL